MSDIIRIDGLSKSYGSLQVLKNISLTLERGNIIGLLGPNGCGKSTLLKIMTGMIKDYTGIVNIDGQSPNTYTKSIVAYLPEKPFIPEWMTPVDAVDYVADFFSDFDKKKAEYMIEHFSLSPKQKVKTMSKGQQEKLSLILVMSRKAQLYILDEPLGGVDPAARGVILNLIMDNYAKDSTVLLSTHLINDVERIFNRVLMINNGQVVINTGMDAIRSTGKTVEDVFKEVFAYAW